MPGGSKVRERGLKKYTYVYLMFGALKLLQTYLVNHLMPVSTKTSYIFKQTSSKKL